MRNPRYAHGPDSRIIGDLIGDDIGDDMGDLVGDDLGDLVGDLELGRRGHRSRRIQRLARHHGMVAMPREQAAALAATARTDQLRAQNQMAYATGEAQTAGHFVADPGDRLLYLPFEAAVEVDLAANSIGKLRVVNQRPMMVRRIILAAVDQTTHADALDDLGVTSVLFGVDPIFNAEGIAPARAFESRAVANHLATPVARVGTTVSINLQRLIAGAAKLTVTGYLVGVSAER
jgi:hypothetical protein